MCCFFTICTWVMDLIQRAWVFLMSCCISSAICCTFATTSMAGIALGYNYSLAEFMDLKETNVSVYLKRGIFDDDMADDLNSRRVGDTEGFGRMGPDMVITAPSDDNYPTMRSGRRLDDAIVDNNDHHGFEGALMKLTGIPVQGTTTVDPGANRDLSGQQLNVDEKDMQNLESIKAVQALINKKKMEIISHRRQLDSVNARTPKAQSGPWWTPADVAALDDNPNRRIKFNDQRLIQANPDPRKAVPPKDIGNRRNWLAPKLQQNPDWVQSKDMLTIDSLDRFQPCTYPQPIRLKIPLTPSRLTPSPKERPIMSDTTIFDVPSVKDSNAAMDEARRLFNKLKQNANANDMTNGDTDHGRKFGYNTDMEKAKALADKFAEPSDEEFKHLRDAVKKLDKEEYDEELLKGLPVRRKRGVIQISDADVKLEGNADHNFPSTKRDDIIVTNGSNHTSDVTSTIIEKIDASTTSTLVTEEKITSCDDSIGESFRQPTYGRRRITKSLGILDQTFNQTSSNTSYGASENFLSKDSQTSILLPTPIVTMLNSKAGVNYAAVKESKSFIGKLTIYSGDPIEKYGSLAELKSVKEYVSQTNTKETETDKYNAKVTSGKLLKNLKKNVERDGDECNTDFKELPNRKKIFDCIARTDSKAKRLSSSTTRMSLDANDIVIEDTNYENPTSKLKREINPNNINSKDQYYFDKLLFLRTTMPDSVIKIMKSKVI